MQSFSYNNSFQLKFPRPSSKSQTKPPKESKETAQIESKPPKDPSFSKEPPRKILKEISNPNISEKVSLEPEKNYSYEENAKILLVENEKLRRKIEFLSNIFENTIKFDENRDVLQLKGFVSSNYKKFHGILDEIYTYKEEIEKIKGVKEGLEKENIVNKSEEFLINNENLAVENEIKEIESKIQEISQEIKEMSGKNEKLRDLVNRKPFFREYELMGKEEEGLKKQNQSLMEMIKREQEKKKH